MMEVKWRDKHQTVVGFLYSGKMTAWNEYTKGCEEGKALADSVKHPIAFLHIPGKAEMPKGNPRPYLQAAMVKYTPSNVKIVAMVVSNPVARGISWLVTSTIADSRFAFFATEAEARQVIEKTLKKEVSYA